MIHRSVSAPTALFLQLWILCSLQRKSFPFQDLNVDEFEEIFKTKAQGPAMDLTSSKQKIPQKGSNKVTLLDANRAKNLAITLRKAGKTADEICRAIHV